MRCNLFVSLALIIGLFAPVAMPTPAEAVTVNITIGTSMNNGRRISCSDGERLIRNRGFRDVRRIDCRGRFFVYRARRGSQRYEIALNSQNGRVADFRRIRW